MFGTVRSPAISTGLATSEQETAAEADPGARPGWWGPAFGVVVAMAAVLRFVALGDRPMHHDESLDAWFSWGIARGGPYEYDPAYHGPLRFFITSGFFRLLGEGETTARLLTASCGVGIVALVGALRRWLGNVGTLAAATMVALSPTMLYFARFGREDTPFALLELALLVIAASWLTRPAPWQPVAAGAVLAAAFATKETSFIVVAVMGSYLGTMWVLPRVLARRGGRDEGDGWPRWGLGWQPLVLGAGAFVLVFSACFSVGFSDLGGIVDGATDGIDYWLSQQPVNRGSMPWPYYLVLLAGYEWMILPFAVVGIVATVRRFDPVRGLFLWTALANLLVYSWASERFPWLLTHVLLPLILLAGLGAEQVWQWAAAALGPKVRAVVVPVGAGLVVVALVAVGAPAVFVGPSDPDQLLVAVQTSEDLLDVRERIEHLYDTAPADDPPRVVIDLTSSATWPWAWYLRDRPVLYADLAADPAAATDADVVLAIAENVDALPAPPGGWRSSPYAHRVWWLPPWDDASFGDWFGWITRRDTFGATGSLDAVMLERPDLADR